MYWSLWLSENQCSMRDGLECALYAAIFLEVMDDATRNLGIASGRADRRIEQANSTARSCQFLRKSHSDSFLNFAHSQLI
jgi:hypothetical protein